MYAFVLGYFFHRVILNALRPAVLFFHFENRVLELIFICVCTEHVFDFTVFLGTVFFVTFERSIISSLN